MDLGLKKEASVFASLAVTPICKNLIQLFYSSEELKKHTGVSDKTALPRHIESVGVLGAGFMGGAIAWLLSYHDISVRLKDISWDAVLHAIRTSASLFQKVQKRKSIPPHVMRLGMDRISGTVEYSGYKHVSLVIEAVIEEMAIKQKVFQELETVIHPETLIVSNTSSLSITELASVLKYPERFAGFHFFSPVEKMPLVEIIPGEKTSPETIVSLVACAKTLKKTPIVVKNCPGFLVNRILMPYVNEAVYLLQEGFSIETIDSYAESFGMPIGPLALADEVGLDVGYKVALHLEKGYGDRMKVSPLFHTIHTQKDWLGKKSQKGFYLYTSKGKSPNPDLKKHLCDHAIAKKNGMEKKSLHRMFFIMVNEAARCIEEEIVEKPNFLDMAMIMGTGFPAFLGGPCRYADEIGISTLIETLQHLSEKVGSRFSPAAVLEKLKKEKKTFYSDTQAKEMTHAAYR